MTQESRIEFFLYSKLGRLLVSLAQFFAPFAGFVVVMFLTWNVETRFFPVITGWTINKVEVVDGQFLLGGTIRKDRTCDLIATSVVAVMKQSAAPRMLIFQIKPGDLLGGNAPTGLSTWGPWYVKIPKELTSNRDRIERLEVVGQHRCHALWHQETVYGSILMKDIPQ